MGKFDGTVEAYEEGIIVNGKKIKFWKVDIAKNIGLDRKYLSRIFKEITGITIRDYLNG